MDYFINIFLSAKEEHDNAFGCNQQVKDIKAIIVNQITVFDPWFSVSERINILWMI
jgi:hypothetical protein